MDDKTTGGIFTSGDRDRVRSPEELDAYIRVIRPGALILVIAMTVVVAALIIWGCTGTMPVTKNANGVMTTIQNRMDNSDKYYGRNYFETVRTVPYNGRCVGGGPKSGD